MQLRKIKAQEIPLLETFLYEAIFIPDGIEPPPFEVIKKPEIEVYIKDFGKAKDDYCIVAEQDGKIIGAVWVRILAGETKGFGNIDAETPEFAVSVLKAYRNQGIGTKLMTEMLDYLKEKGYKQVSLSVDKENYAVKMYKKLGFEVLRENAQDYIMVLKWRESDQSKKYKR